MILTGQLVDKAPVTQSLLYRSYNQKKKIYYGTLKYLWSRNCNLYPCHTRDLQVFPRIYLQVPAGYLYSWHALPIIK